VSLLTLLKNHGTAGSAPGSPSVPEIVFWRDTLPEPLYTLQIGSTNGDEITLDIDADSLVFGSGMRGFASLECDADIDSCNDIISNRLIVGETATLLDNGIACWEGEVVSLPRPSPDDPVQQIICAGRWGRARRNESYGKWFVTDSTYERWKELPVRILGQPSLLGTRLEAIAVDTDRQILVTIPNGTVYKVAQGVAIGFWLFDGQDPSASISRVTCDVAVDPGATQWIFELYAAADLYGGPQAALTYLGSYSVAAFNDKIDQDISAHDARALILYATAAANATAGQDYYIQLRNLVVYAGTQGPRRIDEAIVEILDTDTAIADSSQSEAIGSALTHLVIDPDDSVAGAVEKIEALHSLPVLAGIWDDGELVVAEQPTAPTDRTRYYEVSIAQEGVVWDVQADEEAAVEVVKVVYEAKPENDCGQPNPVDATWPSDWYRSNTTNCYAHDNGDGWQFWLQSDSTALNPSAIYKPSGGSGNGIAVEAGVTYLVRARVRNYAYDAGTSRFRINWYDSSLTLLSGGNIWSVTAADGTEHWVEKALIAPVNAAWAQLVLEWSGVSGTVNQALRARDVEFRPFVDTDVELVEYVPAPPSSQTARMVTLRAGYRTRTEAIAAGEQYLEHYGSRASGPVQIPDFVRDIDGRLWPLSRIRAWDWVICTDYHDPDARGPFMLTGVEIRDGVAMLAIGGVDTYAYDPPEKAQARRGRFRGGKFVWKKVRRKVRGRWRWVKRKVWRKARYL